MHDYDYACVELTCLYVYQLVFVDVGVQDIPTAMPTQNKIHT